MPSGTHHGLDRAILDSVVDYAIFTTDPAGRITSWNPGARNVLGWDADDIVGRLAHLTFVPEDVKRGVPEREMQIALESGRATNERWHPRRDGTRFFGVGELMPLKEADGRVVGFVKVLRDRTPQLHFEQERDRLTHGQTSKVLRLKALADAARSILTASSVSATLQTIAESARHIVGAHLAAASLTRSTDWSQAINAISFSDKYARWRTYEAPTDGSGLYAWVCQTNEPARLTQAELQAHPRWRGFGKHADGHPPLRGLLAVPLVGSDGRNLGLIQLSDKIPGEFDEADEAIVVQLAQIASAAIEQAQTHEALRDSEERFRLAVESSSLGTFDYDVPADRMHWSLAVRRVYGIESEAPVTMDFATRQIHPDDRERMLRILARLPDPDADREHGFQHRIVRPDGQVRWLDVIGRTKVEPDETGARRVVRFAGVVWDVTEQHQLVESLREADQRKDEFLAMLAHELRNPLAPLTNAHRLLARSARLAEADRAALVMADRQTRQLTRLVDDLLEVSRITRGRIELRCEPVSIDAAVHSAIDSVTGSCNEYGHALSVELPPEPVRIVADPARLAQVLENLLHNACKYTPRGGQIRVHVTAHPGDVEIRVADNGIGIEPEKLMQVFELFSQVEAALDRSQGGLGIGLALVKRLVELHGGSVTAASRGKGKGATFTVRLPRAGSTTVGDETARSKAS